MEKSKPVVMQVYCRVEIAIDDPGAVTDLAVRQLRDADIDWPDEPDTLAEAIVELRQDLSLALASMVDPERMLAGLPGVEMRGGRLWAEPGEPSPLFQPGFTGE